MENVGQIYVNCQCTRHITVICNLAPEVNMQGSLSQLVAPSPGASSAPAWSQNECPRKGQAIGDWKPFHSHQRPVNVVLHISEVSLDLVLTFTEILHKCNRSSLESLVEIETLDVWLICLNSSSNGPLVKDEPAKEGRHALFQSTSKCKITQLVSKSTRDWY